MRRPSRARPRPLPPPRGRARLVLEELEPREVLSPVVVPPAFSAPPQTPENTAAAFVGGPSRSSFGVFDPLDLGQLYTADLSALGGTLTVDAAAAPGGITVANNGTPVVTLTGRLSQLNGFFADPGYTFTPAPYFSGDAGVALTVRDPAGQADGFAAYPVEVLPVAQQPAAQLTFPAVTFGGPAPFVVPPGSIVVAPWADLDGSETTTVVLGLFGPSPSNFVLTAGGAQVPLDVDGQWDITAPTPAALQALLDSLVLTPPAGFSGTFWVGVTVLAEDQAVLGFSGPRTDSATTPPAVLSFRAFSGAAALDSTPVVTPENQPAYLAAGVNLEVYTDDAPGDTYAVTFTAPFGVFVATALPGDNFAGTITGSGTGVLTITGDANDIYAGLYALGDPIRFLPGPGFSGEAPVTVTVRSFRADPGSPTGTTEYPAPRSVTAAERFTPVASPPAIFPPSQPAPAVLVGPGPTPLPPGLFSVSPTPDADGSEVQSVVVALSGGPGAGFVLTAGGAVVPLQRDGTWVLAAPTAAELQVILDTLTLAAPAGVSGGYTLRFTARVTDAAFYPSDGTTGTDTNAATLPQLSVRVFVGGERVDLVGLLGTEGQPLDIGSNQVRLTDPDAVATDFYRVTLTAAGATFVPGAGPALGGVVVTGFGTDTLTVDGDSQSVAAFFAATGQAAIDPGGPYASGTFPLAATFTQFRSTGGGQRGPGPGPGQGAMAVYPAPQGATGVAAVRPVASPAVIYTSATSERFQPSAPLALGGYFGVIPWYDNDGSETARVVVTLGGVADPTGFTLFLNGAQLQPVGIGQWAVTAADPAALQAALDALTLTPPPAFTGRVTLLAVLTITDTAGPLTDTRTGQAVAALRFFGPGAHVGPPLLTGDEGQLLPLGGRLDVADPNALPGDRTVLTLTVPSGAFVVNPAALGPNTTLTTPDARTVVLDGPLPEVAGFLGAAGSVTFDPQDAAFSGAVPLGFTLALVPLVAARGETAPQAYTPPDAVGVVVLALGPVASELTPVVADAATDRDTPVSLSVGVPGLAGLGPTETATIQLLGLPPGAALSAGTARGGAWELTAADLAGLTFTPPPGFAGAVRLTVLVTVTDFNAELQSSATSIGTATLTVTVRAPDGTVPTPAPKPTPAPPPDGTPAPPDGPHPPPDGDPRPDPDPAGMIGPRVFNPYGPLPVGPDGPLLPIITDAGDDGPANPTTPTVVGGARLDAAETPLAAARATAAATPAPPPAPRAELGALAVVVFVPGPVYAAPPAERREAVVAVAGSLFARAEAAPPPLVVLADRHPLPPVLPLDQSAPVAGFTDSGGDSLTLVDALYREAAAAPVGVPVVFVPAAAAAAPEPAAQAAATGGTGGTGPTAWAADGGPTPEPAGWSFDWLAAAVGFFAAAWFLRGRAAARWLARPFTRRPAPTPEHA